MQNIGTTLTPGVPAPFLQKGTVLQILSSGASAGLTIQFMRGSQVQYTVTGAVTGWKIKPQGGFDGITIQSATADTVSAIVTAGDVDIQLIEGLASVITNTGANPVPVSLVSEPGAPVAVTGTVNVTGATLTATNVGTFVEQASTVAENAPAAVATTVGALIAAGTRRALRVRNAGSGVLAIGGNSALTLAQAVIVLNPGDVWEETLIPQVAWYAISDVGTTAALEVIA